MPRAEWFFLSRLLQRFKEKNEQIRDIRRHFILFDDNYFTIPDDVPIIEVDSDDGDNDA
jgi:hypothetical protein